MTDRGERRQWGTGLRALPWPVQLIVVVTVGCGIYVALWRIHPSRHQSMPEAAINGAIQGLLLFVVLSLVSRAQGGPAAAREAQRAIRRRRIPDDADVPLLRTGLEGFRRVNLRLRWWFYGCLALLFLLAVLVAALRGRPSVLAIGAIPVVLGIAYPVMLRFRLRRVDALLVELDRRQISDPAPDDH